MLLIMKMSLFRKQNLVIVIEVQKRASSVRRKVTDKLKKKQTNDIPDNYRNSGSILG